MLDLVFGTNQVKYGFVIIRPGLRGVARGVTFYSERLLRSLHFLHRSSDATLICQMGCFRDGVVAGAYRDISLYLLNSLAARLILGKTAVLGFKTLRCTLFCINRPILSEILLSSAASTPQTERHYAFGGGNRLWNWFYTVKYKFI